MAPIRIGRGDITAQQVDVVVNAANERLQHGGGVAAAISRAGGPAIQHESDEWVRDHGPVRPGEAAVTTAGRMPSRNVVHVVGPRYGGGGDDARLLAGAIGAALDAAADLGARSVALPAVSTGIFGYPLEEACEVIVKACRHHLARGSGTIEDIVLVGFDQDTVDAFVRAVEHSEG